MAELKTKKTEASVEAFIDSVPDERKRADARALVEMMREITKAEPKMWGSAIIGFGDRSLKYADGRELAWFQSGFSPRKKDLTLYLTGGHAGYPDLMKALGKHTVGKGCIYIKRLEDVHVPTLKKLIRASVRQEKKSGK
jgi:hypothetical protein